ncbi:MAG: methyltransferase domain-containing protein [Nitrospira sp.]|nr:methyltransferase domain-containing protein [Nitrospira sp. NTP2]MCK6493196.1 methyltransferase domain-containing protein [Nitrospira sp.]MCK6499360.1 methyltransferase domain-containing protein [Nitrospira sp.]MEB2339324.1 methyltransferase domain-containing protein [Nitrospirales bacterium]
MPRSYEISRPVLDTLSTVSGFDLRTPDSSIPRSIAEAVSRLSLMFTREGLREGPPYLDDPTLRAGYLTYFLPVNLAKVQLLLNESAPVLGVGGNERPFRVLDVGCGPGTGLLGILDWVRRHEAGGTQAFEATGVDCSSKALRLCGQLLRNYRAGEGVTAAPILHLYECNIEKGLPRDLLEGNSRRPYDLIVVQNLLSEIYCDRPDAQERRAQLVGNLLTLLSPEGTLMIIEPALRTVSRSLHGVRDTLLSQGQATLYSPCLHARSCPALGKDDDWCHEERPWIRPIWIQQMDRVVGFIKDALKFSYLILRKDGKTLVPWSPELHRVVSELRVMKGERRVWWCDEGGRVEIGRLDRERSSSNAPFDEWHRGAIVRVSEISRKNRKGKPGTVGRIPLSGTAEIVRPA